MLESSPLKILQRAGEIAGLEFASMTSQLQLVVRRRVQLTTAWTSTTALFRVTGFFEVISVGLFDLEHYLGMSV